MFRQRPSIPGFGFSEPEAVFRKDDRLTRKAKDQKPGSDGNASVLDKRDIGEPSAVAPDPGLMFD
jgi:hypothetical protein